MPIKTASFYGQPQTPAQRDYLLDPRSSLARALLSESTKGNPVPSHAEGLSMLGKALLGGYFGNQALTEMRDRENKMATDIGTGIQGAMAKPWVNPDTGSATIPEYQAPGDMGPPKMVPTAPAGGYAGLAAALAQTGNPDVSQMAQNAMLAQLASEQATRTKTAEFAAARDLKSAPGWKAPEAGKDVPLSPAVFGQQKELAQVKADIKAEADAKMNPLEQARFEKIQGENKEKETQKGEVAASLERTIRTGKELLSHPGRQAATGMSYPLSKVPGTSARDFASNLESFKSQNFLPAVQQLKGMGQLSNAEGLKLEAAVGALDPSMSEEAFEKSLKTIIGDLESARRRMPGSMTQPATNQQSGDDDLLNKYAPRK